MTTPPDDALLFDVPAPPTPTERLLSLAALCTQHNDMLDCLLLSRSPRPDPDAYIRSARRLERETHAAVKGVTDQQLRSVAVAEAVVRLKQLAYLSDGAARHLTAAQEALLSTDTRDERPDLLRVTGRHVRASRELTALAPKTVVESAHRMARALPHAPRAATAVQDLDPVLHGALLEVARGHISVTEDLGRQYVRGHDVSVPISVVRMLQAHGLIASEPRTAPPVYLGGIPHSRVRLTADGFATLSAILALPPAVPSPAAARPVPTATSTAPARTAAVTPPATKQAAVGRTR